MRLITEMTDHAGWINWTGTPPVFLPMRRQPSEALLSVWLSRFLAKTLPKKMESPNTLKKKPQRNFSGGTRDAMRLLFVKLYHHTISIFPFFFSRTNACLPEIGKFRTSTISRTVLMFLSPCISMKTGSLW